MCNAWNHPPDCTCGWGGEGNGGGGGYSFAGVKNRYHFSGLQAANGRIWSKGSGCSFESYTVPNAKCPVCDAPVFFYQSPHGGRVFFDELGPPWSKHPCTDNPAAVSIVTPVFVFPSEEAWPADKPLGHSLSSLFADGWRPLVVSKYWHKDGLLFFSGCTDDVVKHDFGLKSSEGIDFESPIFCRKMEDSRYDISWVKSLDGYNYFEPRFSVAFSNVHEDIHVEQWENALLGDVAAQNMVGMMLTFHLDDECSRGAGIFPEKCDWRAAYKWFDLAAREGYWAALNNLGVMYLNGYGVDKNEMRAFELFSKAAQELNATTLSHLADCYDQGIGTQVDKDMAIFLRELADVAELEGGE